MNTSLKIAAGFIATTAGVLALTFLSHKRKEVKQIAYDGNSSHSTEDDSQDGKHGRDQTNENFITDHKSTSFQDTGVNHYNEPVRKVQHHQKGVRHH